VSDTSPFDFTIRIRKHFSQIQNHISQFGLYLVVSGAFMKHVMSFGFVVCAIVLGCVWGLIATIRLPSCRYSRSWKRQNVVVKQSKGGMRTLFSSSCPASRRLLASVDFNEELCPSDAFVNSIERRNCMNLLEAENNPFLADLQSAAVTVPPQGDLIGISNIRYPNRRPKLSTTAVWLMLLVRSRLMT
jgi:hypothetical protein